MPIRVIYQGLRGIQRKMCVLIRILFRICLSFKLFLLILSLVTTTLLLIWIMLINRQVLPPIYPTNATKLHLNSSGNWIEIDTNVSSANIKYVLLWHHSDFAPFYYFLEKDVFKKNNCSFTNCHVTTNRSYFGKDLDRFHAIAFNCRMLGYYNPEVIPRSPHQKFIFVNTEASVAMKINTNIYDGFFNWTLTYKLDSDIPYPYLLIRNSSGAVVGPKLNMKWKNNMRDVDEDLALRLRNKSKIAVAFVSNCRARSGREVAIYQLRTELKERGYELDVYGACSNKKCEKSEKDVCDDLVKDYYFYLAFENALAEDYVTEKLLRPLLHDTVPIVFGRAKYSRFLPPGSYLDFMRFRVKNLVTLMIDLMKDPERYRQFFAWRKHYSYHDPMASENVCGLCAALNNETKYRTHSAYNIRDWWNEI